MGYSVSTTEFGAQQPLAAAQQCTFMCSRSPGSQCYRLVRSVGRDGTLTNGMACWLLRQGYVAAALQRALAAYGSSLRVSLGDARAGDRPLLVPLVSTHSLGSALAG